MRNQSTLNALCRELQRNCGDELEACKAVGVSPQFVRQWAKDDKETAEALNEATRVGEMGLVSAAIRRGVHGVEEDVYYKGMVVGQKTNYSDSLLTTLLKAKVPEFAKDAEGGGTTVNVNVANLMPRATDYTQWLQMKDQTLVAMAPPAEPVRETIEAEFEKVSDVAKAAAYFMRSPFEGVDL